MFSASLRKILGSKQGLSDSIASVPVLPDATVTEERRTRSAALMTGLDGPLALPREMRLKTAIFSDGSWLIHERYLTDPRVRSLKSAAFDKLKLELKTPEPVPLSRLQNIEEEEAKNNETDDEQASATARDYNEVLELALEVRANDILINHIADVATVQFQINGYLTPSVREFHGREAERFFTHSQGLADHGDRLEQPLSDQKYTITDPEKLPKGIMGLRAQVVPTTGRALKIRCNFLSNSFAPEGLKSLPMTPKQRKQLYYMQHIGSGLIIFAGPTESGKSATLNLWLSDLMDYYGGNLTIFAADDPPEGIDPRIINFDVRGTESSTEDPFARAMGVSLRFNPELIKIGELRSQATAEMGYKAANMGKPVGATVHCGEALAVPDRLLELGLAKAAAFHPTRHIAWVSQRLMPLLCHVCSVPIAKAAAKDERLAAMYDEVRANIPADIVGNIRVRGHDPKCPHCCPEGKITTPGIVGRQLILEIILPTPELLSILSGENGIIPARKYWLQKMDGLSMRLRAYSFMREGLISPHDYTKLIGPLSGIKEDLETTGGRFDDAPEQAMAA